MTLTTIEAELLEYAQGETRRWQHVAALLMRVEQEKLWQGHATSFTAWLEAIARRADLQESVFWRALSAGRAYLRLTGATRLDMSTPVSAESVELVDKIARHAPRAVRDQIVARTLQGELSRAALREVWATYRPAPGGLTARGRLPEEPAAQEAAASARLAAWDAQKRLTSSREQVRRGELMAAFQAATWLDGCEQVRAESRVEALGGGLASVLIVRRERPQARRLELHGLWTCAAAPALADFPFEAPWAMDFVWLAVPAALASSAVDRAPRMAGVLALDRARKLVIRRAAQKRPVGMAARIELLSMLLERVCGWR